MIGIILNLILSYLRDELNFEDVKVVWIVDVFFNCLFFDLVVKGEFFSELIERIKEFDLMLEIYLDDLMIIKENIVDFLGINYY